MRAEPSPEIIIQVCLAVQSIAQLHEGAFLLVPACIAMVALDLFGRRGTLRVLWELRASTLTFRALLEAAETNPALLNTRLKNLRATGIVEHAGDGYTLTPIGHELIDALVPLTKWAERWAEATERTRSPRKEK